MTLSKYQKFTMQLVHRSQLQNAPYNPRVVSRKALKRLKANLKSVGLTEAIIWNERTGNLVGGHQRLAALDAVEGRSDYSLHVAVVQLTDVQEREQNIFLNNPAVQGEWDLLALQDLLGRVDVPLSADNAGFDADELLAVFPQPKLQGVFADPVPAAPGASRPPARPAVEPLPAGEAAADPATDPTAIVVFATREDREYFAGLMGCDPSERYLDGRRVLTKLGLGG